MCYCYILFSPILDKFYVGACHTNLHERVDKHNTHYYGKRHFTALTDDWQLFLAIEVDTYGQAIRVERKIKSMKSSTFIKNLHKYPELVQKIIKETST